MADPEPAPADAPVQLDAAAAAAADDQEQQHAPDLLLSFQRPDGSMSTPRPDDVVVADPTETPTTALADDHDTPRRDYFSLSSAARPSTASTPVSDGVLESSAHHAAAASTNAHITTLDFPRAIVASSAPPSTSTSSQQASSEPANPRALPRRAMTEYPVYPNQAHAALQSQMYPDVQPFAPPPRPGMARIHPLQTAAHRASAPTRPTAATHTDRPADPLATRFLPLSPVDTFVSSPGPSSSSADRLYRPPSLSSTADEQSPAPSPYLHPTQSHLPKETTRANRDVDTVSGRKTINQYEILDELGRGVHGKVKLARNLLTSEYVAIKIVQRHSRRRKFGKSSDTEDKVKREIAILKKTSHPNVVSLIEVIDDPEMTKIYIVLEFCDNHEVIWRTAGASEIVLMEHRRLERERSGDDDIDSTPHTERIMRAAQRRRERERRNKRKTLSRVSSVSDFWSLEFQDVSDDDNDTNLSASPAPSQSFSAPLSRATSVRTNDRPSRRAREDDDDNVPPDVIPHSQQSADDAGSVAAGSTDDHHHHHHHQPQQAAFDLSHLSHLNQPGGAGSGSDRGRQPSVAESTLSRITEYMRDEIEEDQRYVPTMTLAESRAAFRDAVLGIEYLHYQGIVHRDIKPANLLRKADYRVKISDFGVSYLGKPIRDGTGSEDTSESEGTEHEEDTELAKTVGTPAFYAPELCSLDFSARNQRRVTGQIDVWALGVTLYCLIYARTPFTGENEFQVMRSIADDDVFLSRKRLKAVDTRSSSRSNSHGPLFRETREHRLPSELVYEDIDEELHDLLRRLFIKDPEKRIKLTEIKHHPWVLRDIARPRDWIEETTPHRQLQGKKIEISNDEVRDAVIPLKVIERAKSMVRNVAGMFSFGGRSGRRRTQSNASSDGAASYSSLPHSDTSSGKARRTSAMSGDHSGSVSSMHSVHSRPGDHHPLSQSVTASPEAVERARFFDDIYGADRSRAVPDPPPPARPVMPPRHDSTMSTAASIQTVRQVDMVRGHQATPPGVFHAGQPMPLSGLEHTEEPNTSVANILGKAGESLMRTIRNRDGVRPGSEGNTPPLSAQASRDQYVGSASTAVATARATGHPHPRPLSVRLDDGFAAHLNPRSPVETRPRDSSSDRSTSNPTRASSSASVSASGESPYRSQQLSPLELDGSASVDYRPATARSDVSAEDEFHDALNLLHHRQQLEHEQNVALQARARPRTSPGDLCPLSPDDESGSAAQNAAAYFLPLSPDMGPTRSQLPASNPISSGSSADQLNSNMSQSTSYPSGPSIASANTDYPQPSPDVYVKDDRASTNSSDGTAHDVSPIKHSHEPSEDGGYAADFGPDDDQSDSDNSEEDLVMMPSKRKTPLFPLSRAESHSSPPPNQSQ